MQMMRKSGWMSLICLTVLMAFGYAQEPVVQVPQVVQAPQGDITGYWSGILQPGPQKQNLKVVFQFKKQPDGSWTGYLHRISQDELGIPTGTVSFKDGKLKFTVGSFASIGGTYEGTLNEAGTGFQGTWTQDKTTLKQPLEIEHVAAVPELSPPQEPKRPYPYRDEAVTFDNQQAGIKLAGTLTTPPGARPCPAIILVQSTGVGFTGGPRDRNLVSASFSDQQWVHKPFLVLADHLTRRGLAVLRLDDRGVGGSTGMASTASPQELATDVLAGLAYLKTRREINPSKIGLLGYGEGGVVAPLCAAQSPDVKFMVLMAPRVFTGLQWMSLLVLSMPKDQERAFMLQMLETQGELQDIFAEEQDATVIEQKVRAVSSKLVSPFSTPYALPNSLADLGCVGHAQLLGVGP